MNSDDLDLKSVNFEHGMLLTPDHFLRQERYFDSMLLWALRYTTSAYGLVGGGPRLAEIERGAARYDPILSISEDEESLKVSVSQCRAITPAGCIVEIDPSAPLQRTFSKAELDGVQQTPVYILCEPHEKEAVDGVRDDFNPQMQTERRPAYKLALATPADQVPYALVCGQLRKQRYSSGYEKNPDFIPACTTMTSHSQLAVGFRKIVDDVTFLAERYSELHRAMREYLTLFTERGIETEVDTQTVQFVDRIVVALQHCVYELLDSAQPPQKFFGELRRFVHSAAVYFDLTPGMQTYYETLKEAGETSFIQLIEKQKAILKTTRTWTVDQDLGIEVRAAMGNLAALTKLELALEGKYLDFRVSPTLDAMNFVFDRGGNVLYKLAAKPSRVQGAGGELITYFSQLHLEGRDKYRLVLVGENGAVFESGTRIAAEIRVNEGSGFQRQPMNMASEARLPGQVNFEYDFEAPDVPTITDLRVSVQAHHPIKTALLFSRHRFYAGRAPESEPRVKPMAPIGRLPENPAPQRQRVEPAPADAAPRAPLPPPHARPAPPYPQPNQPQQPPQPPYPQQQAPYPPPPPYAQNPGQNPGQHPGQQPPQQPPYPPAPPYSQNPPQGYPPPPQPPYAQQPPPPPEEKRAPWDIFKRNPEPPRPRVEPQPDVKPGDEPPPPPRRRRLE